MKTVWGRDKYVSVLLIAGCVATAALILGARIGVAQSAIEGTRRFELRLENGRLANSLKIIRVGRGDMVELNWSADRRTVLHLHGYDIEITVDAGKPQTMSFKAQVTGRFPIERHDAEAGRHAILLYIEVHPK
jgi:hypothetical protein